MIYNADCRAWLYFNDYFHKIWRNERECDLTIERLKQYGNSN